MKINQFTTKNIYEGLRKGEYYIWKVNFQDGTSTRVKIKYVETSKETLEKHFGKPIASIDHNFGIHGGDSDGDTSASRDYHAQQDRLDRNVAKSPWSSQNNVVEKHNALNELSTQTMNSYKDAASSEHSFKTRPLRKLAKSVNGVADANRKIDAKHKTPTYEDRLAGFVAEAFTYAGQITDPEERSRITDLKSLYGMFGDANGIKRARHLDSKGMLNATAKEKELLYRMTDKDGTISPRIG